MALEGGNFAFVMNLRDIPATSLELLQGDELRRVIQVEIDTIKRLLKRLCPSTLPVGYAWETSLNGGDVKAQLETDRWRYFVVSFSRANDTFVELQRTFEISPLEMEIGFTVYHGNDYSYNHGRLIQFVEVASHSDEHFVTLTDHDVGGL